MPRQSTKGSSEKGKPELRFAPVSASISVRIQLNEALYIRNPQDSKFGRSLLLHGIALLDEIGLEEFTFKKLAQRMDGTEASVYRYFSNKHVFLAYLSSYYWSWIRYRIEMDVRTISDPVEQLLLIIQILVDVAKASPEVDYIDMEVLHRIVVAESTKVYRTKMVDEENRQGFFLAYKALCSSIAGVIKSIQPEYPYPKSLATTLMEMAKDHMYFAHHLPRLTDIQIIGQDFQPAVDLLRHFAFTQLRIER